LKRRRRERDEHDADRERLGINLAQLERFAHLELLELLDFGDVAVGSRDVAHDRAQ
jgi:hypothetical protein